MKCENYPFQLNHLFGSNRVNTHRCLYTSDHSNNCTSHAYHFLCLAFNLSPFNKQSSARTPTLSSQTHYFNHLNYIAFVSINKLAMTHTTSNLITKFKLISPLFAY